MQVKGCELRVRPVKDVIAELQAEVREHFGNSDRSAVDDLNAERRAEAAREEL